VQLRELLAQAKAHGWLDPERKRPLPTFPRAIAIITSKSAAALQDVLVTMQKRCPAVGAIVIDSRVQGQQAVGDVVAAFAQAAELAKQGRIDAVIVTRGGGSVEDLWCFHDLAIARAIVQCPVPVVAAIGHETDTSIAELVADERCATPTQAAMRLTPDRVALQRELHSMQRQLLVALKRNVERRVARLAHARAQRVVVQPASLLVPYRSQLEQQQLRAVKIGAKLVRSLELRWNAASQRMHKQEPSQRLRREQDRIDATRARMQQAMQQRMRELAARLEASKRQFHAIGPTKVLERGYSVTTLPDGTIVRDPSQAPPGTKLLTRVTLGDLASTVEGAQVAPWNPKRSPSKVNRGKSQAPGGPGLFG
jgi:exodeoxyribonuclease VII large subunit